MAKRRMLYLAYLCHGFATGGVKSPYRLLQPHLGRVQVRGRLREIRMAEHFLNVVDRPAGLEPATAGLMSQIVENSTLVLWATMSVSSVTSSRHDAAHARGQRDLDVAGLAGSDTHITHSGPCYSFKFYRVVRWQTAQCKPAGRVAIGIGGRIFRRFGPRACAEDHACTCDRL